jgi:hypothetical protein
MQSIDQFMKPLSQSPRIWACAKRSAWSGLPARESRFHCAVRRTPLPRTLHCLRGLGYEQVWYSACFQYNVDTRKRVDTHLLSLRKEMRYWSKHIGASLRFTTYEEADNLMPKSTTAKKARSVSWTPGRRWTSKKNRNEIWNISREYWWWCDPSCEQTCWVKGGGLCVSCIAMSFIKNKQFIIILSLFCLLWS